MVLVQMRVAERVDELARLQAGDLSDHQGQQRVGSDVEGNAQKHIGTALVQLAGEPSFGHVELEQQMAGGRAIRGSSPTFQALTIRRRESGSVANPLDQLAT